METLKRPSVKIEDVVGLMDGGKTYLKKALEKAEVEVKYSGYLERQRKELDFLTTYENISLPNNITYDTVAGLSNEAKASLKRVLPGTIAEARRLQGVNPSDIIILIKRARGI